MASTTPWDFAWFSFRLRLSSMRQIGTLELSAEKSYSDTASGHMNEGI